MTSVALSSYPASVATPPGSGRRAFDAHHNYETGYCIGNFGTRMGLAWSIPHAQGRWAALLVRCSRWHRHWTRSVLDQPLDISKTLLGSRPDGDLEHIYRSRRVWFLSWRRRLDPRHAESNRVGGGRPKHERLFVGFVLRSSILEPLSLGIREPCTCPPLLEN